MNVIQAIKTKRSVREYAGQEVPLELITQIVDAGRRAQSSRNSQPWTFIVVRQRQRLQDLAACGMYAQPLGRAAFGVALVSAVEWGFDIGQAAAYMQLAGWSLGVSSCLVWLGEADKARALLGVLEDQHIEMALAFGYALGIVPKSAKKGGRKPLDEVVRWETWEGNKP